VFFDNQDGTLPSVPAEDRTGAPHDFSASARLAGAVEVAVYDQGRYDDSLLTSHLGIVNSPEAWAIGLDYLTS